jgi:hypothetical protein
MTRLLHEAGGHGGCFGAPPVTGNGKDYRGNWIFSYDQSDRICELCEFLAKDRYEQCHKLYEIMTIGKEQNRQIATECPHRNESYFEESKCNVCQDSGRYRCDPALDCKLYVLKEDEI